MNARLSPLRTAAALGAAITLTIAACGGDDDASTADAPTTDAAPTTVATTEPPDADEPTGGTATSAGDAGGGFYGNDPGGAGDAGTSDGATITIADFAFGGVSEVPVGTTVVVTNTDNTSHTWSAVDGTFDSGALRGGDTFEFTFTEPGEFEYFCNFHPSMTGRIVVTG